MLDDVEFQELRIFLDIDLDGNPPSVAVLSGT
jgi:hypothetical protein